MSNDPKPAPHHPHRPYVVRIFGRSFRVHATTLELARIGALRMIEDDDISEVVLDDGQTWGADEADSGPLGVLLPDPGAVPGIWYDLGEFGKWATDGRCAFHESLAWRVQRHRNAEAWTSTGRTTVDAAAADPTAKLTRWLAGAWEPVSLRFSDLQTSGVGPLVEGPGDLGLDQKLHQPFARDEWFVSASGGGDNVVTAGRIVGVKRAGRFVALIAPVAPSAVREAREAAARKLAASSAAVREVLHEIASEPVGPDSFPGTDEGSHLMAQTSAAKLRETPS